MPLAHIESLDHEGRGVAHVDGKVIFIEGSLPGELVEYGSYRRKPHNTGNGIVHARAKRQDVVEMTHALRQCQVIGVAIAPFHRIEIRQRAVNCGAVALGCRL